jgi:DeoR/GlpR family transcriptional regulator of sugar metabolism
VKAARRQARILQLIGANPGIRPGVIASRLSAPIETIRSDMTALESEGMIRRGRGRADIIRMDMVQGRLEASGALSRSERQQRILRLIAEGGEKRVSTLSARFGVSVATIRADLGHLDSAGRIARTHGGVRAAATQNGSLLPHLAGGEATAGLVSICRRAAAHIETGDVVFLDGSSAGARIALEIPADRGATVVTNNLRAAAILAERGYGGDVFVLPG